MGYRYTSRSHSQRWVADTTQNSTAGTTGALDMSTAPCPTLSSVRHSPYAAGAACSLAAAALASTLEEACMMVLACRKQHERPRHGANGLLMVDRGRWTLAHGRGLPPPLSGVVYRDDDCHRLLLRVRLCLADRPASFPRAYTCLLCLFQPVFNA